MAEIQGNRRGPRAGGRLLEEAEQHHVSCVCLFTRIPEFFAHLGFAEAKREELPDKIYKDCANCPKLHECDEVAMYRGELPQFAILPRPAKLELRLRQPLVKLKSKTGKVKLEK